MKRFKRFSSKLMGLQSSWHHIDGQDIDASNIQFANVVLAALQTMNQLAAADDAQDNRAKTDKSANPKTDKIPVKPNPLPFKPTPLIDELVSVESHALEKADYKKQLHSKQHILAELIRERVSAISSLSSKVWMRQAKAVRYAASLPHSTRVNLPSTLSLHQPKMN
ncbi:MAG: hypothetical protein U1E98_01025 [Moraxella osloensis]